MKWTISQRALALWNSLTASQLNSHTLWTTGTASQKGGNRKQLQVNILLFFFYRTSASLINNISCRQAGRRGSLLWNTFQPPPQSATHSLGGENILNLDFKTLKPRLPCSSPLMYNNMPLKSKLDGNRTREWSPEQGLNCPRHSEGSRWGGCRIVANPPSESWIPMFSNYEKVSIYEGGSVMDWPLLRGGNGTFSCTVGVDFHNWWRFQWELFPFLLTSK